MNYIFDDEDNPEIIVQNGHKYLNLGDGNYALLFDEFVVTALPKD